MPNKAEKAIILAAGVGERLKPLTGTTPKPLLNINGTVMIESLIEALIINEIKDIYIVVGYLKEQFTYLPEKYSQISITLIDNPDYAATNNISSLYAARHHLGNCVIADGDQLIHNPEILDPSFEASGYCSARADETTEWLQTLDRSGYVVSCSRTGGKNGWQLYSISFWSETDGQKLREHLEELYKIKGRKDIYWDDIPMFAYPDEYRLKIREINHTDLTEVDDIDQLTALENNYLIKDCSVLSPEAEHGCGAAEP